MIEFTFHILLPTGHQSVSVTTTLCRITYVISDVSFILPYVCLMTLSNVPMCVFVFWGVIHHTNQRGEQPDPSSSLS